ncbi:hypothetical protein VDGE_00473 [Verticillium dahliae]|uniref:Uncharacterized protein n=1 Tax=Verticillium dahliae TaxID=27337 RepID=A0A444S8U5_VERDA|nr:hypothetical protein VDGE_00473 [Verticillium dahliae]
MTNRDESDIARTYLHNAQYEMNEGDTVVYINMPSWTLAEPIDCVGDAWRSLHVKMHSDKIRSLKSSKFSSKLKELPPTPPLDKNGFLREELVGMNQDAFEVDPAAVNGHDDVCHCGKRRPHFELADERFNIWSRPPDHRNIPDYCPIRHRICILRLLYLIEGKHVLLDSAPRVWTMIAISKIFGCLGLMVKPVAQWLLMWRNSTFLEVLPEEGLQIGMTFKFIDVTRFVFEILVYEKALKDAGDSIRSAAPNTTIFGRKSRDAGDDLDNMVQHAAQALVQRNSSVMTLLGSDTVFDDMDIPEWKRLAEVRRRLAAETDSHECAAAVVVLDQLKQRILHFWRKNILEEALGCLTGAECGKVDDFRFRYVAPNSRERLNTIYDRMNPVQKGMCLFFHNRINTIARTGPWQPGPLTPESPATKSLTFAQEYVGTLSVALKRSFEKVVAARPQLFADFDRDLETGAASRNPFRLVKFDNQVFGVLRECVEIPRNDFFDIPKKRTPSRFLTNHFLAFLVPDEVKFLPVWAGGQDDGTGRVFNDELPPAEDGPDTGFRGGAAVVSPSVASMSVVEGLRGLDLESVLASETTSMNVLKDGSIIYNPGRVIVDDESIHSETFTETGDDYEAARWEM